MKTKFEDFAIKRQKVAGRKYRMDNGDNKGLYRNGLQDVLEELADGYVILGIFVEKYIRKNGFNRELIRRVLGIIDDLQEMAVDVEGLLDVEGVDKVAKDDMRVDRPVQWDFNKYDGIGRIMPRSGDYTCWDVKVCEDCKDHE